MATVESSRVAGWTGGPLLVAEELPELSGGGGRGCRDAEEGLADAAVDHPGETI